MKVELKSGNIVITLPIAPRTSKSGKSLVVASTSGNVQTDVTYEDKPIVIGVNAYVRK